jgi:hypothetical protein
MHTLVLLLALGALTSCASFRSGNLTSGSQLIRPSEKPSISVVVTGTAVMGGEAQDLHANFLEEWTEDILRGYRDSGLFDTVRSGLYESDLRAEVSIENSGDPNQALAFLSGLTLTLIPAKATDHLSMTTEFKSPEGETLATVVKQESVNTWIQLFLIFAMPFNWPGTVVDDVFTDLVHETLAEAGAEGVFQAEDSMTTGASSPRES